MLCDLVYVRSLTLPSMNMFVLQGKILTCCQIESKIWIKFHNKKALSDEDSKELTVTVFSHLLSGVLFIYLYKLRYVLELLFLSIFGTISKPCIIHYKMSLSTFML